MRHFLIFWLLFLPALVHAAQYTVDGSPSFVPAETTFYADSNQLDNPYLIQGQEYVPVYQFGYPEGYTGPVLPVANENPYLVPKRYMPTGFWSRLNAYLSGGLGQLTSSSGPQGRDYGLGRSYTSFKATGSKPVPIYRSRTLDEHSEHDCEKVHGSLSDIQEVAQAIQQDKYAWRPPEQLNSISQALLKRIAGDTRLSPSEKAALKKALENAGQKKPRSPELRALEKTISSYLDHYHRVKNRKALTLIDYNKGCNDERSTTISLETGEVLLSQKVAHGKGVGAVNLCRDEPPKYFSNVPGTNLSSYGPMLFTQTSTDTRWTDPDGNRIALEMKGLAPYNRNVYTREIKAHIYPDMVNSDKVSLSAGCPMYSDKDFYALASVSSGDSFLYINPSDGYKQVKSIKTYRDRSELTVIDSNNKESKEVQYVWE